MAGIYLKRTEGETETVAEHTQAKEALLKEETALCAVKDDLTHIRKEARELSAQAATAQEQAAKSSSVSSKIAELTAKKAGIEADLKQKEDIYKGIKELDLVRHRITAAHDVVTARTPIEKELMLVRASIAQMIAAKSQELAGFKKQADQLPEAEHRYIAVNEQLVKSANELNKYKNTDESLKAAIAAQAQAKSNKASIESAIRGFNDHLEKLRTYHRAISTAQSHCPMCERSFTQDSEKMAALANIRTEAESVKDAIKQKEASLLNVDNEITRTASELNRVHQIVTERNRVALEVNRLTSERHAIEKEKAVLIEAHVKYVKAAEELAAEAFVAELRKQEKEHSGKLELLAAPEDISVLRNREAELQAYETKRTVIESAEHVLAEIDTEMTVLKNDAETAKTAHTLFHALQDKITAITADAATRETREADIQSSVNTLSSRKAVLDARIADIDAAKTELAKSSVRQKELTKRYAVLTILTDAYNVKGIPLMLYNQYMPVLTEKVNSILGIIRQGWKVDIEASVTSRDKFHIPVMTIDPDGVVKSYTARSGGERFMLSLAFLIGMARFWEARTGKKRGAAFIDEGLDKLDKGNINIALSATTQAILWIGQVGIITHKEELKQMGEVQVYLYVDDVEGSKISIGGLPEGHLVTYRTYKFTFPGGAAVDAAVSIAKENLSGLADDGRAIEMYAVAGAANLELSKKSA